MLHPGLLRGPINKEACLRLLLLALQVLVSEEGDGAADEDQGVDAHAEAAGVRGLGCAGGGGRRGGGLGGWVACLFIGGSVSGGWDWVSMCSLFAFLRPGRGFERECGGKCFVYVCAFRVIEIFREGRGEVV